MSSKVLPEIDCMHLTEDLHCELGLRYPTDCSCLPGAITCSRNLPFLSNTMLDGNRSKNEEHEVKP